MNRMLLPIHFFYRKSHVCHAIRKGFCPTLRGSNTLSTERDPLEDSIRKDTSYALWKLLAEQDIDSISVSSILDVARRSRSSFYRRFEDKYDLLLYTLRKVTSESGFLDPSVPLSSESVYRFLLIAQEEKLRFRHAFSSREKPSPYSKLMSLCATKNLLYLQPEEFDRKNEIIETQCAIYSYEVLGLLLLWIKGDCREPVESVLATYCLILSVFTKQSERMLC